MSLVHQGVLRDAFAEVSHFRSDLYACMTARGDALFELCDALLCTMGRCGRWSISRSHRNTVAVTEL